MKFVLRASIVASAMVSVPVFAGERCFVEGKMQDFDSDAAQCLYYKGTEAYRVERYDISRKNWEAMLGKEGVQEANPELAMNAHNNLGYLNYWGLGGAEDEAAAVDHLMQAAAMGGDEAHYHLCYMYGYTDSGITAPDKARSHCLRALAIYEAKAEPTETDRTSLEEVRGLIAHYGFEAE